MGANKSIRYLALILPAVSCLAVFGAAALCRSERALATFALILGVWCVFFAMQNSFAVLPLPRVRFGDLRILDNSFPVNPPDWFDDNHPLDRRDFHLAEVFERIESDAGRRYPQGESVNTGLLVHGLLVNHDYLELLARQRSVPLTFSPFYLTPIEGPSAPEYLLSCKGCGAVYPGRHYINSHPEFAQTVASGRAPYEILFELPAPAQCRWVVYRKRARRSELMTTALPGLLSGKPLANIDVLNSTPWPSPSPVTVDSRRLLQIRGWAIDPVTLLPASGVYVEIAGRLFQADYGVSRPDVATAFHKAELSDTGFAADIPMNDMPHGNWSVTIRVANSSNSGYYNGPSQAISIQ